MSAPAAKRRRLDGDDDAPAMADEICVSMADGGCVDQPAPITTFSSAPFPAATLRAVAKEGFKAPTPVQSAAWPLLLSGHDLVCVAKTGSGKTICFLFPAFSRAAQNPQPGLTSLVIAPTRELAMQIHAEAVKYGAATGKGKCRSVCLNGGGDVDGQVAQLEAGRELAVATPGRLLFLSSRGSVSIENVSYLVLDEADRLLDMGFQPQIRSIVDMCLEAPARQTALFSATWSPEVEGLVGGLLSSPVMLRVGQGDGDRLVAASEVKQTIMLVPGWEKSATLKKVLSEHGVSNGGSGKALVFVNTKKGCQMLADELTGGGMEGVDQLHANLQQQDRERAMRRFASAGVSESRCLVATDVAARGVDVDDVTLVVCYDFPEAVGATGIEEYVHRIGRTGRAGRSGCAVTFFPPGGNSHDLVRILSASGQPVPEELRRLDKGDSGVSARQKRNPAALQKAEEAKRAALSHVRVSTLTREISAAAQKKQISVALSAWRAFKEEGLTPTAYTYAGLIHAYVNSGDLDGAWEVLEEMKKAGHKPNIVVYTTVLKGCCNGGDMEAAQKLVDAMVSEQPPVMPDLRTVGTLLRGCVRVGDVALAQRISKRMGSEWGIGHDAVTCRCVVQLLTQGLRVGPARALLSGIRDRAAAGDAAAAAVLAGQANDAALPLCCATAAALLARADAAEEEVGRAEAALAAAEENDGQTGSLFDSMRMAELKEEASQLRQFLATGLEPDLAGALQRTFLFSAQLAAENPRAAEKAAGMSADAVVDLLWSGLRRKMGAARLIKAGAATEEAMVGRLRKCVDRTGKLRWKRVFGDTNPVRIEVCSGNGDWVAAQAKAEAGEANWAAMELRHDRVHRIVTRAALGHASNLAVVGGDAAQVLPHRIAADSVEHVCVNFPEPPYHTGAESGESQFHLLTADFFEQMHRVVRPNGGVCVFSDSRRYLVSLARTVAGLVSHAGDALFDSREVEGARSEDVEGVLLYRGVPGPECGHAVKASSYFDRFWEHGNQVQRFYLALVKRP